MFFSCPTNASIVDKWAKWHFRQASLLCKGIHEDVYSQAGVEDVGEVAYLCAVVVSENTPVTFRLADPFRPDVALSVHNRQLYA